MPTKLPNFEFSLKYKKVINLNKKEIEYLNKIQRGEEAYKYKMLNTDLNDFTLKKLSDQPSLREEIGFITRGGYSQIRGKGIGIGLAKRENIAELYIA